jgi:hypothetical protein
VSLALFVAGETEQAARAIAALGALYSRADHATAMDKMTGARAQTNAGGGGQPPRRSRCAHTRTPAPPCAPRARPRARAHAPSALTRSCAALRPRTPTRNHHE